MNPMCFRLSLVILAAAVAWPAVAAEPKSRVVFQRDDAKGQLQIQVDGKEALVYNYGADVDLPHFYPVRSPSGQSLTVQKTDPYPHHRSVWFADTVQLAGHDKASFYNAYYSRENPKDPKSPFHNRIRQVEFEPGPISAAQAEMRFKLVWEMGGKTPVLDELRGMRLAALGDGEYFLDLKFTVTATYGDVKFVSDAVHYAWPYVRMDPQFSVAKGGRIANSEGGVDQKGTHGKPARWVDYANTVGGVAEGLAIFSHSDNGPASWLTRDYGTFGPRRPADQSGKPFVVKKGETLKQRVGILVHKGNVADGRVAERYRQYTEGKL